jgi:hypothetical protein
MTAVTSPIKAVPPVASARTLEPPARVLLVFTWLSLYGAGVHFFDNVVFFDEYPEPAWLTPLRVALLFVPMAWYAQVITHRLYMGQLGRALRMAHAFVFAHLISLGHYLFASPFDIPARINALIGVQAALAVALLLAALWVQRHSRLQPSRPLGRLWAHMLLSLVVVVVALEWAWPSKFNLWWMA